MAKDFGDDVLPSHWGAFFLAAAHHLQRMMIGLILSNRLSNSNSDAFQFKGFLVGPE